MRIRTIKPDFFKNDELANLPAITRLLYIGLWCMADGHGKLADRPKKIRAEVLPYEKCNVESLLDELCLCGFIVRYTRDGKSIILIKEFLKHQRISGTEAMTESDYPDPETFGSSQEAVRKQSGSNEEAVIVLEGKGREGKGKEGNVSVQHSKIETDTEMIRGLSTWVQWRVKDPERTAENRAELLGLIGEHGPGVIQEAAQRAVMANKNKKVWPDNLRNYLPSNEPVAPPSPPDPTHEAARAILLAHGWEACSKALEIQARCHDDMLLVIDGQAAAKALVARLGAIPK